MVVADRLVNFLVEFTTKWEEDARMATMAGGSARRKPGRVRGRKPG
jgi:hypothetical protein